jgi:hypothetical protein
MRLRPVLTGRMGSAGPVVKARRPGLLVLAFDIRPPCFRRILEQDGCAGRDPPGIAVPDRIIAE